jgi:hypothetical protein
MPLRWLSRGSVWTVVREQWVSGAEVIRIEVLCGVRSADRGQQVASPACGEYHRKGRVNLAIGGLGQGVIADGAGRSAAQVAVS